MRWGQRPCKNWRRKVPEGGTRVCKGANQRES